MTQLCQLPFVKIEKALGVRDGVIMVKHLIPNLKDIILPGRPWRCPRL